MSISLLAASGCIEFPGHKNVKGYGKIGGKLAHRVAYERTFGPIPEGLEIDHRCQRRSCINPSHLEAVTHVENVRRAVKPTCVNGHPYRTGNTRRAGARRCYECHKQRERARRTAKKIAEIGFEAFTNAENARIARKTTCKNGHEYDIMHSGRPMCRVCWNAYCRERRAARKLAAMVM